MHMLPCLSNAWQRTSVMVSAAVMKPSSPTTVWRVGGHFSAPSTESCAQGVEGAWVGG